MSKEAGDLRGQPLVFLGDDPAVHLVILIAVVREGTDNAPTSRVARTMSAVDDACRPSIQQRNLVAWPGGSLHQDCSVDPDFAIMSPGDASHHVRVRLCRIGIERYHLAAGVAVHHRDRWSSRRRAGPADKRLLLETSPGLRSR